MKVQEIMSRDVIGIKPDDNVKEASNRLFQLEISGLPVIDEQGKLKGMFTEKNILQYIFPSYIEKIGRFVYEEEPKSIKKRFMELENMKVAQLMRREVVTVFEDTAVSEAARIMLTQKVRRIPVLNKENKVVGMVAREDVVKSYIGSAGWKID